MGSSEVAAAQPESGRVSILSEVLTEHLEGYGSEAVWDHVYSGLTIGNGAVLSTLGLFLSGGAASSRPPAAVLAGTGAVGIAGGVTSFVVDVDYQRRVADASVLLMFAGVLGAFAVARSASRSGRVALLTGSGALVGHSALLLTDTLLLRPVSPRTLADHAERLDARRDGLTDEVVVARAELDYARTLRPIDSAWLMAPYAAAGAVALAFSSTLPTEERGPLETAATFELAVAGLGVVASLLKTDYSDYQDELAQLEASVMLGPGTAGLVVDGRF